MINVIFDILFQIMIFLNLSFEKPYETNGKFQQ